MVQKLIAISEDEYNSFKHDEYEQKIKMLEERIEELEVEKTKIANAKAVRLDTSIYMRAGGERVSSIALFSDNNFENEILNCIKDTEFRHIVGIRFPFFSKEADYIEVNDVCYYKNELCEKLKKDIELLISECADLENKRDELKVEIKKLNERKKRNNNSFLRNIIKKL